MKNENEQHLHWVHPDKDKFITLAFNPVTKLFYGINTYGIRMRHEVFDNWLSKGVSIQYVMQHLKEANFDPEFYRRYEKGMFKDVPLNN